MKNPFKNPKGMELALRTIIVIILLLIVLGVVAMYFLGGMNDLLEPLAGKAKNISDQLNRSRIPTG